jgi:hypothetical protein
MRSILLVLLVGLVGLAGFVPAAPAAAAEPRFALFDVDAGLAPASRNVYGDVNVEPSRAALVRRARGATVVRCGSDCRFGRGWLAFAKRPLLTARDVAGAARAQRGAAGWSVRVRLTPRGVADVRRLRAAASSQKARTGLPPVYAVVLDGRIDATPLATQLRLRGTTLVLGGFTRAAARRAVAGIP